MPLIKLCGISKTYDTGGSPVHALQPTDLEIVAGRFISIMGQSGSGKSTLLNILGMLDRPTNGEYRLNGHEVAKLNDNEMSDIRCRNIGIIFQSFNLFSHFSILENVCVPMRYAGNNSKDMHEYAAHLLDKLGLGDRLKSRPNQLSGGQCQRVAIARSLANNPPVILADEPTGNLDEKTGNEVMDIFHELVSAGRSIIMVTHNPEYESQMHRVIHLQDGKVVSS